MEGLRLDFLEDLQRTMKEKQISQKDLAEKIGKTEAYVSKVINSNISNFTLETMVQLAMAVGSRLTVELHVNEKTEATVTALREAEQDTVEALSTDELKSELDAIDSTDGNLKKGLQARKKRELPRDPQRDVPANRLRSGPR